MTFVIGAAEALELLTDAVTERGERYVYPEPEEGLCLYWHGGEENEPGCLVGLALAKAGADQGDLIHLDRMGFSASDLAYDEASISGIEVTPQAADIFQRAQSKQDAKKAWGEALEAAKRQAEEYGITEGRIAA